MPLARVCPICSVYVYLSSHSPPFLPLVVIVMKFIMKLSLKLCLTAGAADVNNYCPVNPSTQVAGQFPVKRTCLFTQVPNLKRLN